MQHRSSGPGAELELFRELVEIVARLRGPGGCPWDREQTQQSLTRYVIEEAFELVEAIDSGDQRHIAEELGDYLFQVVLQAQVARDEGLFELSDVLRVLNEKMVRRHPHVFGDVVAATSDDVLRNWEKIKAAEKSGTAGSSSKSPPAGGAKIGVEFPALLRALKIGKKSETWKFDWETPEQVRAKVVEELAEVDEAISLLDGSGPRQADLEAEVGDLLFAVSQWARHLGIDPEAALRGGNRKFEMRFADMIADCGLEREAFAALPLDEKNRLWELAKKRLRK